MWKCIIAALLLVLVFCAGHASAREGHRGHFEQGYRGGHMMQGGDWRVEGNQYYQTIPDMPAGNRVMMYRTVNTMSTSSAAAVPAGTMMMAQ